MSIPEYRISHITDLLQIAPEHWDEAMRDLRSAVVSLHLVQASMACVPGVPSGFEVKDYCPFIVFKPDGTGEASPSVNGVPLFSIKVTKDTGPTVTMPTEVADAYEEVARLAEKRASLTCHGGDEADILEALDNAVVKLRKLGFTTSVKDNNEGDHA